MARPSPRLRAAILQALPERWTTAREIAKNLDLWSWKAVSTELSIMVREGLVAKRIEEKSPSQLIGFYCKAGAADANPA
jgi:predicted transcriptional regulator